MRICRQPARLFASLLLLAILLPSHQGAAVPMLYEPGLDPVLGVNLPNWQDGGPGAGAWEAAIQQMYDNGFREVSIIPYRFVDSATGVISATSVNGLAAPSSDAQIAAALAKAEALGMTATLNPFLHPDNASGIGHVWRGGLNFTEPTLLETFFTNYTAYITSMADLAVAGGADRMLIGSEMVALTGNSSAEAYWRSLITAVDGIFGGTISYAANHTEYAGVPFWDALDEVGVDAYFGLASSAQASGVGNPSVATITANWAPHLATLKSFGLGEGKPIVLTEWGCVPQDLTTVEPWNWDPNATPDPLEQLNAYQATVTATDLTGDWLGGINFWHWSMPGNDGSAFHLTPASLPGQFLKSYLIPEPGSFVIFSGLTLLLSRRKSRNRNRGNLGG